MSILLNQQTRVIVQGMTGREGSFHTAQMQMMGTTVVGGVSPGKGGTNHLGVPVFNTVAEAVAESGAVASGIFIPAPLAADAIMEAAAAGIRLIVCITEGIPIQDMIRVKAFLRRYPETRMIGPNCPGLLTPGQAKIGIIPQRFASSGPVGIVSRSGTLTYESVAALSAAGWGQSTVLGIGGDPINGTSFVDAIRLFEADPETTHLLVIGEIGGSDEERAAELLAIGTRLKVVAFISGRTAPEGKRMGHAGAIVTGNKGTAASKEAAFREAGVTVAETTEEIIELLGPAPIGSSEQMKAVCRN
ncbi:MAG: succinate--CoA ligase subunit alpha [Candidatus Dormibacteraceae bacterium]